MLDHRSLNNRHEISGTDQVLDGGNVRDRFLTAFILRHGGVLVSAEPLESPDSSSQAEIFFALDAASLEAEEWAPADREIEPLALRLIDPWSTGGDDEM
jgi:hypothetical protein